MKKTSFILIFLIQALVLQSQDLSVKEPPFPRFNVGFGGGLDYGGFGTRATLVASKRLEFFGAIGYNLLGAGFNAGADFRLAPKSKFCPYFGLMYGYNAVIKVQGASEYNKTYYGPSLNLGLEIWGQRRPNFLNIELIVPMRSRGFHDDLNNLKNNSSIIFKNDILPIAFSIGYHFSI